MRILRELSSADPVRDVGGAGALRPIDSHELARHAPDRHAMMLDERDALLARCSWWSRNTPPLQDHRVGAIGHYEAADASAGTALITHACGRLADAGCTLAVAPMDGNTWRRYRLVVERGTEPPFFLEPDNPDDWPSHFVAAGFTVMAAYTSALNEDLTREDPALDATAARLAEQGITIRPFDPAAGEAELGRIFTLSLASFSHNFLYTPIDRAEFMEQYRSVLPVVRPELVLIAERGDDLVGFLFAVPDVLEARRSGVARTVILKTMAVAPEVARAGLGGLLIGLAQRQARRLGFQRAIHALMHERNFSRNISRRYARTIRRYALFARPLTPGVSGA